MSSPTPSTTGTSASDQPAAFKVVGVILAVVSGLLIGASFVFKKKGLLASQKGGPAGEGVGYLKSPMWWTGMTMMILGELCNFGSYAFIPAIIVTPLGALSVVICAILSSIFLKETLTFFGWCGCFLCIVGSVIIAINGPQESTAGTIREFQDLFLSLGFIIFGSMIILSALIIIFFVAPKWGTKSMLWYILVCSLFGGLSVSCTQGLGSSIVTSIRGDNQFNYWFTYFLLIFVAVTLVTEIFFLNKALALFNTAMVTPTYYVIFTFFTLVTSVILYRGVKATVAQLITVVLGFLVICCGIVILQMSKVDPTSLKGLDRKSTILLQATKLNVEGAEKNITSVEEPGMDALRGSFGAFGSIIRARSMSRASTSGSYSIRNHRRGHDEEHGGSSELTTHGLENLPRTQLWDAPVPSRQHSSTLAKLSEDSAGEEESDKSHLAPAITTQPPTSPRAQKIRFGETDVAHYYPTPGRGEGAVHSPRPALQQVLIDEDHPAKPMPRLSERDKQQLARDDPFRDTPSQSTTSLISASGDSQDVFSDRSSSPEETRKPYNHTRGRAYPGGNMTDDDEEESARESLVAHDSGSTRGGIRLIPSKSPRRL